jgi:hyperosmotically inducible periplasmic protein
MRNTLKTTGLLAASAFALTLGVSSVASADAGQYISDAAITTKVKAALLSDSQLKATKVSVETTQGVVQLSGSVDSKTQENAAVTAANKVDGVKSVKDLLSVDNDGSKSGSGATRQQDE